MHLINKLWVPFLFGLIYLTYFSYVDIRHKKIDDETQIWGFFGAGIGSLVFITSYNYLTQLI